MWHEHVSWKDYCSINMVTKKLKIIFLLTLFPIYLHGIEEIITGFPRTDSFMRLGANYLSMSSEQFYWIFHLVFWVSLPALYFFFHKTKTAVFLFSLFGLFFIVETHHIIKAFYARSYYPGLLTGLIYPIIGIFYWKELVINWRNYGRR